MTKNSLEDGIVFSVGAAGARMPTTCVPAYRCGADFSGWLMTAHSDDEMVKLTGQSALVIVHLSPRLVNNQQKFLLKAVGREFLFSCST